MIKETSGWATIRSDGDGHEFVVPMGLFETSIEEEFMEDQEGTLEKLEHHCTPIEGIFYFRGEFTDEDPEGDPEVAVIKRSELDNLRADRSKLRALEAAGVDNWEGFDHAMDILREEEEAGS